MNLDSAPGRFYWCCDGERFNALLARARRIAAAQGLDALAGQLRALDDAWIHAQVTDEERRALLVLCHRRRAELLKPKGPLARALRLPNVCAAAAAARRQPAMNLDSAPADPGRFYWCCDGERFNALLARARRIAAAQGLDALAGQLRALDDAWIHAQVTDEERRALLVLCHRRRAELLKPKGPLARALRLPNVPRRQGGL